MGSTIYREWKSGSAQGTYNEEDDEFVLRRLSSSEEEEEAWKLQQWLAEADTSEIEERLQTIIDDDNPYK